MCSAPLSAWQTKQILLLLFTYTPNLPCSIRRRVTSDISIWIIFWIVMKMILLVFRKHLSPIGTKRHRLIFPWSHTPFLHSLQLICPSLLLSPFLHHVSNSICIWMKLWTVISVVIDFLAALSLCLSFCFLLRCACYLHSLEKGSFSICLTRHFISPLFISRVPIFFFFIGDDDLHGMTRSPLNEYFCDKMFHSSVSCKLTHEADATICMHFYFASCWDKIVSYRILLPQHWPLQRLPGQQRGVCVWHTITQVL